MSFSDPHSHFLSLLSKDREAWTTNSSFNAELFGKKHWLFCIRAKTGRLEDQPVTTSHYDLDVRWTSFHNILKNFAERCFPTFRPKRIPKNSGFNVSRGTDWKTWNHHKLPPYRQTTRRPESCKGKRNKSGSPSQNIMVQGNIKRCLTRWRTIKEVLGGKPNSVMPSIFTHTGVDVGGDERIAQQINNYSVKLAYTPTHGSASNDLAGDDVTKRFGNYLTSVTITKDTILRRTRYF